MKESIINTSTQRNEIARINTTAVDKSLVLVLALITPAECNGLIPQIVVIHVRLSLCFMQCAGEHAVHRCGQVRLTYSWWARTAGIGLDVHGWSLNAGIRWPKLETRLAYGSNQGQPKL